MRREASWSRSPVKGLSMTPRSSSGTTDAWSGEDPAPVDAVAAGASLDAGGEHPVTAANATDATTTGTSFLHHAQGNCTPAAIRPSRRRERMKPRGLGCSERFRPRDGGFDAPSPRPRCRATSGGPGWSRVPLLVVLASGRILDRSALEPPRHTVRSEDPMRIGRLSLMAGVCVVALGVGAVGAQPPSAPASPPQHAARGGGAGRRSARPRDAARHGPRVPECGPSG